MEDIKTINSKSCKEIYVILNKLGMFYKLPEELKEYISKNQSLSYNYDFDMNLPLIYQIDNEKTKAYISYLYLKYINDNVKEKDILLKKYEQNEKEYIQKSKEIYNYDNLFKKKHEKNLNTSEKDNTEMILYEKETFFKKVINSIKKFLHII